MIAGASTTAATPTAERDARYARIRTVMAEHELDGLLAYVPGWRREDARYLADAALRGSFALIHLPLDGAPIAFTVAADRAAVAAAGWVTDLRTLDLSTPGVLSGVAPGGHGAGTATIGVSQLELMPVTVRSWLESGLRGARLASATRLLSAVRLVKSPMELERLRRCGEMTDAGWDAFISAMRPGRSEYEIVAEVEARMKTMGATDNFMLIASGGDQVRGMAPASARRLTTGDMVRTELTPQVDGYWTQICRSAVLGPASDGQKASHELFAAALDAGLSVLRAGVTAHDVAMAENDVFRARGYGEYCTAKHTRVRGHGLGTHFDEVPLVEGEETVLQNGTVVIVHPNTYTPLAGYHVLGDPVVVTTTGWQPLLSTTRMLFEVAE